MFRQFNDILTYIALKITLSLVRFTPLLCIIYHKFYNIYIYIYRVSQEECARLREGIPYVKV